MKISKKQMSNFRKQENEKDAADVEYSASLHNLLSEVFGHFGQMYKMKVLTINQQCYENTIKQRIYATAKRQ